MQEIDFVIPWVDGADPEWRKQKASYSDDTAIIPQDSGEERYRDWGILPYWFRGVEKYAPWVRRIHFITCGHVPEWLNLNHPKLNFVRHEDYIPRKWLPVFSPRPIELNVFRIGGLAEKFVFFNDDIFINAPVRPEDFFVGELPCATAALNAGPPVMGREETSMIMNDILIVAEHFSFKEGFRLNFRKWLAPCYGAKLLMKTLLLIPFMRYTGFHECHTANSYLKSTFIDVWEKERAQREETCSHRFRQRTDVNQWLMEYWQLASGKFHPRSPKFSAGYGGGKGTPLSDATDDIRHHRHKLICINDSPELSREEFASLSREIRGAFNEVLPEKSSFEL